MVVEKASSGWARTAGGGSLKFMPYVVSFELKFNDIKIVFCRARVHNQDSNTCLLVQSDLPYNRVSMICSDDLKDWRGEPEMILKIQGKFLDEIWPSEECVAIMEENLKNLPRGEILPLERTPTVDERLYNSSVVENMKPTERVDPDAIRAHVRHLEKIHQENREKNSWKECKVNGRCFGETFVVDKVLKNVRDPE